MFRKFLLWGIGIFIIIFLVLMYFSFTDYSHGQRAGRIIKFSEKGVVFKTWEGELDQSVMVKDDETGINTRIWKFSVLEEDTSSIRMIQDAMAKGTRVNLFYNQKYFKFIWNGETKYFINKADQVN